MAEIQHLIQVSDYEQRLMVNGLNAFRNDLIRDGNTFIAQCVGNILCQRNGIDGKSLAVTQLPQKYAEMEPKQLREELKSIRTAANQISADMFRFLDAKSHGSKQRDDAR